MDGTLSVGSLLCPQNDRKRNRDQVSHAVNRSPCHNQRSESSRHNSQSSFFNNLHIPPFRFPGDGIDMRRPTMSHQHQDQDVIDLTLDSGSPQEIARSSHSDNHHSRIRRANRPSSEIINLDETHNNATNPRPSSPEITFIRSRPRSRSASQSLQRNTSTQTHHPQTLRNFRFPTARSQLPPQLPSFTHTLQHAFGIDGRVRPMHHQQDQLVAFEDFEGGLFEVPEALDFITTGFNIENPSRPAPPPPRLPTYEKPAPPRAGFTRSTSENDILTCPNCEGELGVGDDDLKKQVWVVKSCGHVYCGECTKYRSWSKNKSGIPPSRRGGSFAKCVVRDCAKAVSARAMVQVYL